jgi:hypothetical protein
LRKECVGEINGRQTQRNTKFTRFDPSVGGKNLLLLV